MTSGNQKGEIGVEGLIHNLFDQPAPHEEEQWYGGVDLAPRNVQEGQPFTLVYRVGGGGGHQLRISSIDVRIALLNTGMNFPMGPMSPLPMRMGRLVE